MVERSSKDLLQLETNPATFSNSCLESKLFVCKKDGSFPFPEAPVQKPTMFPLPKSEVLGKVKDFLGIMAESNKKLTTDAKNNPDNYDIEVLSGKESEYIEMDLMLGVADLHTPEAVAAAESAMAGNPPEIHLAESSSASETEDSSDEDDEAPSKSVKTGTKDVEKDSSCNPSKQQNPKKRNRIVELP